MAFFPNFRFVSCYFNRISGSLKSAKKRKREKTKSERLSIFLATSPVKEDQIVIGAFFSVHYPPVSHGGGRLRQWFV